MIFLLIFIKGSGWMERVGSRKGKGEGDTVWYGLVYERAIRGGGVQEPGEGSRKGLWISVVNDILLLRRLVLGSA